MGIEEAETAAKVPANRDGEDVEEEEKRQWIQQHLRFLQEG